MLAEPDRHGAARRHPLDQFVPDPAGRPPLCDEETFAQVLEGMVADEAPRLFAVVQEYGCRVDARIAAWGMAFEDRATVVAHAGGLTMRLSAPENCLRAFHIGTRVTPQLVWHNPDAATPEDDGEG